jgi:signal transduction histidine kinase
VQAYGTENGLVSNGIKGLIWEEQTGFLWIATEAGIVRFNGKEFRTFSKYNTTFIASERMQYIVRNHAGDLIAADEKDNIFKVMGNSVELWSEAEQHSSNYAQFTAAVSPTFFHNNKADQNCRSFRLTYDRVIPITDTSCYIYTQNQLFYFSAKSSCPKLISNPGWQMKNVFSIQGNIFILDNLNRIFRIMNPSGDLEPVDLVNEENNQMDLKGSFALYSKLGMKLPILLQGSNAYSWEYEKGRIKSRTICDGVPGNISVKFIEYSDKRSILFLGTDSKGIYVVTKNSVKPARQKMYDTQVKTTYYAQLELRNGNVLTNEAHQVGDQPAISTGIPIKGPFKNSLYLTEDSVLWFIQNRNSSSIDVLYSYHYHTGRYDSFPKINGYEKIAMQLLGDKMYVATYKGIALLSGDSLQYLYRYPRNSINGSVPYKMIRTASGSLMLATCDALVQYELATNTLDTIYYSKDHCIRTLWETNGYLFFGTYGGGYFVFKDGYIKQMPLDKAKFLQYTHCFIPDNQGRCWISTNRGLIVAKIDDMLRAVDSSLASIYYHYVGKADGMEMTEMNGGCDPCAIRLKNGVLSFPTMDGLLWVDPASIRINESQQKLFLDDFIADGLRMSTDSAGIIRLLVNVRDIKLKLGYPSWGNRENVYLYYTFNSESNWRSVTDGNETEISFSNLPPGMYNIWIRRVSGFGVGNESTTLISFEIPAPWYARKWAIAFLSLLFLGSIFLIYRLRVRQFRLKEKKLQETIDSKTKELMAKNQELEQIDRVKTRLISIISHDLITPLKFINLAGVTLLEKIKGKLPEQDTEVIQEIANTSQDLQSLSSNILNWIKYQRDQPRLQKEYFNLHELVGQVFSVLKSSARVKSLQLENHVNTDLVIFQYMEPVKIIIYNLLTNAINFSNKGTITVSAHNQLNDIVISVKDEGTGMPADLVKNILSDQNAGLSVSTDNIKRNGLGYMIIHDLLIMIDGKIAIESSPGEGTAVNIKLETSGINPHPT